MKYIFYVFPVVLLSCGASKYPSKTYLQKHNYMEVKGATSDNAIDVFPMYPNGIQGISEHITDNVKYPDKARNNDISGRVKVKYIVATDGYVSRVTLVESVHPLLDNEAIRVIKKMQRWIPGIKNGKPVPVSFVQPINFKLE